ncbi:MAG: dienelactone hydrolase family protein [bacterium]|nr:dienelactone hydrolase family protein [bacterium]
MEAQYSLKSKGFLAKPANPNGKAVILVHEFWGLNQQMKNAAGRVAKEGFLTLAVDLYEGKLTADPAEARKLKDGLAEESALENLRDAIKYSQTLGIKPEKIALWGFCMGGGFTFQAATRGVKAGAYVIYYGRILDDKEILANIQSPLLGIFGGLDQGIPRDLVERFHAALHDLEKPHEVYIYPEADHAFANEERPVYNEKSAKDAWSKTITFLNKYL